MVKLIVLAAVSVASVALSTCSTPPPATPPPIAMQSTQWQVGQAATLTVSTHPPRAGQPISLTLLAPGTGSPLLDGRDGEFFGLGGVQLSWLSSPDVEQEIWLAAAAGATLIGLDFEWQQIEPQKGHYDWSKSDRALALAKRHQLRLVPMLLYTPRWASSRQFAPLDYHRAPPNDVNDYRDFVYAVVKHYKPHGDSSLTSDGYGITDWVIWNEPNVRPAGEGPEPGEFWTGSIEQYVQLLRAGYEGAHAADPACNVLNGGLADVVWADGRADLVTALERLYDPNGDGDAQDGGRAFFDTLNVHLYQFQASEAGWYRGRMEALLHMMERFGDEQKPVWVTETGYGSATYLQPVAESGEERLYVGEAMQAKAVRLVYETLAAYPNVKRVFWWSLRDYHSNAAATNTAMEAHYGLLRANFAPKPAYAAYGRLTGRLGAELALSAVTDAQGLASFEIPAAFIHRAGTYIAFASLDESSLAIVSHYEASP